MHMKWYTNNDVFHSYDMCVLMCLKESPFLSLPFLFICIFFFKYDIGIVKVENTNGISPAPPTEQKKLL